MNTPEQIDTLADQKLSDAILILNHNPVSVHNARYLAGYAVELTLKAKICRHLEIPDLFAKKDSKRTDVSLPFRTHHLYNLVLYAGLNQKHEDAVQDPDHYKAWSKIVNRKPV